MTADGVHLGGRGVAALLDRAVPMCELLAEITYDPVATLFSGWRGRAPTMPSFREPPIPSLHRQLRCIISQIQRWRMNAFWGVCKSLNRRVGLLAGESPGELASQHCAVIQSSSSNKKKGDLSR
jgi:hypothetical protein